MSEISRRSASLLALGCAASLLGAGIGRASEAPGHAPGHAKEGPVGTGLPLPRYVSLKSERINARAGPGGQYPIDWVFVRRGLPVEITQEFEHWRKVRDFDGAGGWVHTNLLSSRRTALIRGPQTRDLRREADARADTVARTEPGVIARVLKCRDGWCQVSVADRKGWIVKDQIWGVYPNEQFD